MYLRTTKRKNRDGSEVTYFQLAESVWNAEKRQSEARVLFNFGRADEVDVGALRRLADSIRRVCDGTAASDVAGGSAAGGGLPEGLELLPAKHYGGVYVIEALWRRVGLGEILAKHAASRRGRAPHEVALLAMVANRLLAPSSKLACYDTWLPRQAYFPAGASLKLAQFYAAMDFLAAHAEDVEKDLFFRVADLFSLDVDLIFYDTTTAYFETDEEDAGEAASPGSSEPIRQAARRMRGHNKEGRDGQPQVIVALAVTRDGLPVRSWVFPGNTVDVKTVARVREDLRGWRLTRLLFVGDAGMYSAENMKTLSSSCGRYLLAAPMRKVKEVYEDVLGRAGRYKEVNENLSVKEVVVGEGEARRRYFLCLNQREAERQKRHREHLVALLDVELAVLAKSKKEHPKKAAELIASQRFRPYLSRDEKGRPFLDKKRVEDEARFDGKWVVTTNDDSLSPEDGALGYKALLIIESCFRRMKTTGLKLRPVFHWTNDRIIAHVKICVLALLIERVAEIACTQTWRKIRIALEEIQVIPCETPSGSFLKTTRLSAEATALLVKLKIAPPPRLLAVTPKSASSAASAPSIDA